jgi:hypothetical protein
MTFVCGSGSTLKAFISRSEQAWYFAPYIHITRLINRIETMKEQRDYFINLIFNDYGQILEKIAEDGRKRYA